MTHIPEGQRHGLQLIAIQIEVLQGTAVPEGIRMHANQGIVVKRMLMYTWKSTLICISGI